LNTMPSQPKQKSEDYIWELGQTKGDSHRCIIGLGI
jgi:hypothetical protein